MSKAPHHFLGFNHGYARIDLREHKGIQQMRPTEIHLKEDGSISYHPSFAIVMEIDDQPAVFGQISLEMLNKGLSQIGFEITRK